MLHISLRGFSFVPKFARVFLERALHQLIARVWQGAGGILGSKHLTTTA